MTEPRWKPQSCVQIRPSNATQLGRFAIYLRNLRPPARKYCVSRKYRREGFATGLGRFGTLGGRWSRGVDATRPNSSNQVPNRRFLRALYRALGPRWCAIRLLTVTWACYRQSMGRSDSPKLDLPLLGEPLAVELANSLYFSYGKSTDFIATVSLLRLWAAHVEPPLRAPPGLRAADVFAARQLRDAVRQLLTALAGKQAAPVRTIKTINRYAAAVTTRVELAAGRAGQLSAVTRYSGGATIDVFLGRIAIEAIVLAAGLLPGQLKRCRGPGCAMLFVRIHHRRQWCHASCGHRARQASYYRRKSAEAKRKESRQ